MVKASLIFVLAFLFAPPLFAQALDTAWVRTYNGPANLGDWPYAIVTDNYGNVFVTGESEGRTGLYSADYATVKYDADGNELWAQRYNGSEDLDDRGYAIAVDDLGNVFVTGESNGRGTNHDYATIKYAPNGDTAWVRRYNGPTNGEDKANDIAVDIFGNAHVTGTSFNSGYGYEYATVKYYPNGDTAWVRTYHGPVGGYDEASAIAVDDLGNVYVTGKSYGGAGTLNDYATIKYYPNGDTAWVRRYNGPGNDIDWARDIAVDDSGNVYVTGSSIGSGTSYDYATLKYDPAGNQLWEKRYNGPGNSVDVAYAIAVDGSGNIYVTGQSSGSSNYDYATIKYYPNGDTAWVRRYNGSGDNNDWATAIAVDSSGNVYVTGNTGTVKYNTGGNQLWVGSWRGVGIAIGGAGNVYVTDRGSVNTGSTDYVTIKYWQNYPPNAFSLLSPVDSAIIPYVVTLDWESAMDPDPWDTVKYDLYVSTSPTFHSDSTVIYDSLFSTQYTDTLDIGRYYWKVKAYDKHSEIWSNQTWTFLSAMRGDANADKQVTVADVIYLINYLFRNGPPPHPFLLVQGDVNCDGKVSVADVVYLINYLFKGGTMPCEPQ